ncbi:hypothetical protein L0F63_002892 [Massospora cicadina]|nr:hypothetical protein L0F63_002892 [Massospora cicadina]
MIRPNETQSGGNAGEQESSKGDEQLDDTETGSRITGDANLEGSNSTRRDPLNYPMIVMYEPIYIESIKKSSISIKVPCTFRWRLEGKPEIQPDSFTLTLLERRGQDVTYVIKSNISASETSYVWDIPNYRPSKNNDEAITLRPGGIYKMILHDGAVKYNTLPSGERYALSAREFTLYSSSDPNSHFTSSSPYPNSSLFSLLLVALYYFISILMAL